MEPEVTIKESNNIRMIESRDPQTKTKYKTFIVMQIENEEEEPSAGKKVKRTERGVERKSYSECLLTINELMKKLGEEISRANSS